MMPHLIESLIEFDGFTFNVANMAQYVPFIYIAHRARRGEVSAIRFMNAFDVHIVDHNDKPYWPMESTHEAPQT